ncbi:interleukin-8-like [Ambystoma mexicanum]|uniref:interleukin-8-like n=1 Tax=Ambystoma mexicanum TaxID=8296 RepID=UPI0037E82B3B
MNIGACLAVLALLCAATAPSRGATINRTELRCQCINTEAKPFSNKQIANIELTPHGAHCPQVEVIATLKSGSLICLDPEAKWVKLIIRSILHRASHPKREQKD